MRSYSELLVFIERENIIQDFYGWIYSAGRIEDIGRATKDPACFQKLINEYKESMCVSK